MPPHISKASRRAFWPSAAYLSVWTLTSLCLWAHPAGLSASEHGASRKADPESSADRPNVLVIMTDDQGYGDLACHGNKMLRTPRLDQLARESFRLENFHVDPTCSETRAALMTGKYSMRVGVWHTIMGRSILRSGEMTMAEAFRENGYRTGMFGKWHLGDNYPYRPEDRGFDEVLRHGGGGVGQTPDYWGNDYFDDTYWHNGTPEAQTGYCTDVFAKAAMRFMAASKEPFFCYLATNAAHGPYLVDEAYSQPYLERGVPPSMARFYGMITNIDENVGNLLDQLDEQGVTDNTIVIFLTDNGTAQGAGRRDQQSEWKGFNAGMRGAKGSQYDGGHRVPCFIRFPAAGISSGSSKQLTAHFDLFPTLVQLCELDLPLRVDFDGQSLVPVFAGEEQAFEERMLVVQSQRVDRPQRGRKHAVMQGSLRLVDLSQLYDLSNDPSQQQDLSEEQTAVVARLQAAYDAWWKRNSTRIDQNCEIPIGAAQAPQVLLTAHDWHAPEGGVPWNQTHIQRDQSSNGQWAIRIERPGRYRIQLSSRPPGYEQTLSAEAGTVRLTIGESSWQKPLAANAESITFEVDLAPAATTLKSVIASPNSKPRGAYFATVEGPLETKQPDQTRLPFRPDERLAVVGGSYIAGMSQHNYLEALLLSQLPSYRLEVFNLGLVGEDVTGKVRFPDLSLEDRTTAMVSLIHATSADWVLISFGHEAALSDLPMNEFITAYRRLIEQLQSKGHRLIIVGPHRFEKVTADKDRVAILNATLRNYERELAILAAESDVNFIPFFEPLETPRYEIPHVPVIRDRLTADGYQLSAYGYWRTALTLAERLGIETEPISLTAANDANQIKLRHAQVEDGSFRVVTRPEQYSVELTIVPAHLALNSPPEKSPRGGRMMGPHDRLAFPNLPPGNYGLQIDGRPSVVADHESWALGIYVLLAESLEEPSQLLELLQHKHRFVRQHQDDLFSTAATSREQQVSGGSQTSTSRAWQELTHLQDRIWTLTNPSPVQIKLERVANRQ